MHSKCSFKLVGIPVDQLCVSSRGSWFLRFNPYILTFFVWRLVKANKGSPGVDGMSFEAIESGIGVGCYLELLSRELQDKTYQANPVRRVMIPKADGSLRPLGIPTIRDRVV